MGEEVKQEQAKAAEAKPEEKKEEKPEEKEKLKSPSPFVLFVDLHCVGYAKKIERSIMKIRGVEGVVIDMAKNEVTIKGIVEPQAICNKIMKKTKRKAKVLSPLPPGTRGPVLLRREEEPKKEKTKVDYEASIEALISTWVAKCERAMNFEQSRQSGPRTDLMGQIIQIVLGLDDLDDDQICHNIEFFRVNPDAQSVFL